jgi:predicted lipoprotein with Yx(FWY)xxD motif
MRSVLTALALVALLAFAACGDDEVDAGGAAATVSIESVNGADVLVDSDGAALYTSEQERDGDVRCTAACASSWLPLTLAGPGKPTAGSDVPDDLGVVERPDGARQVTFDGRPLYRFADDGEPGEVSGDGLADSFGGRRFTWHVATSGENGSSEDRGGGTYSY